MISSLHINKFSEHCGINFIKTSCLDCLETEGGIQAVLTVRATETAVMSKEQEPKGPNILKLIATDV